MYVQVLGVFSAEIKKFDNSEKEKESKEKKGIVRMIATDFVLLGE
jgi:hypothetical protein